MREVIAALVGLIVDDGLLAGGTVLAILAAYLLSRSSALGPAGLVGWLLFAGLVASLVASLRRAIRRSGDRSGGSPHLVEE